MQERDFSFQEREPELRRLIRSEKKKCLFLLVDAWRIKGTSSYEQYDLCIFITGLQNIELQDTGNTVPYILPPPDSYCRGNK